MFQPGRFRLAGGPLIRAGHEIRVAGLAVGWLWRTHHCGSPSSSSRARASRSAASRAGGRKVFMASPFRPEGARPRAWPGGLASGSLALPQDAREAQPRRPGRSGQHDPRSQDRYHDRRRRSLPAGHLRIGRGGCGRPPVPTPGMKPGCKTCATLWARPTWRVSCRWGRSPLAGCSTVTTGWILGAGAPNNHRPHAAEPHSRTGVQEVHQPRRSLVLDERMTADLRSSAELADAGVGCVALLRSPVVVSAGGGGGRAGLLAGR